MTRHIDRQLGRLKPDPDSASGIDLGAGRHLEPEDVLESHFRRLAERRRLPADKVSIQVADNLVAAIAVLSPNLAPLTELAEEVADAVPPVSPTPQFRANLHEALERTHRQYAAQRVLGTREIRRPTRKLRSTHSWLVAFSVLLLVITATIWRLKAAKGSS